MTAFKPIGPQGALRLVEPMAVGDEPGHTLADFAEAGLIKAYARVIETCPAGDAREEVRDSRISRELWRRIIAEGKAAEVYRTGSVRLAAADQIGGEPAVNIIGIRFDEAGVQRLVESHSGADPTPPAAPAVQQAAAKPSGRHSATWWAAFAEELAVFIHDEGVPDGAGADGQGAVIEAVQTRMTERGIEHVPTRSSIQGVVQNVLDRVRAAEK